MKNKVIIFFIFFIFSMNSSLANEFKFETQSIQVLDEGNLIKTLEGKALSKNGDLQISASNFEYYKKKKLLKAFNGEAFIKSQNLNIKFDTMNFDEKNYIYTALNQVSLYDLNREILIKTKNLSFDGKNKTLESISNSIIKDKFNNILDTETFIYNLDKGILKVKDANLKDFNNNILNVESAFIDVVSNKLIGKDVAIDFNNESFNKDNEPRLKGKSVIYDSNSTLITKGVFTTCKKRDDCPPWELSSEKIEHNKKKKIINYKNAWLKVYDVPVMYFPKFFHPDPTVDRKSGFLIPTIKNSPNSDNYLSVPYFQVVSMNKDFTFTPRFYTDDKFLLQTEYRQANLNSNHISDFSIFNEEDKDKKNHFFYEYNKDMSYMSFDETELNLQVQRVSNDTYLKANKLESKLIESNNVLESYLDFNLYSDDLQIETEFKIYEDLNKDKNDRYEFILPRINLAKNINNKTNLNGNFKFMTDNYIKNYDTNTLEKVNINDITFNSNPKITKKGFYNNFDFILKNVNTSSQKSNSLEGENFYLSGLFQLNSSIPLKKENNYFKNIITPKIALKLSPEYTENITSNNNRVDINNVYNLNRLSSDTVEGGASLTYGNDFSFFNKIKNLEIFSFKIANNLRLSENNDLPNRNELNEKSSNIFGELKYRPNEFVSTKYNFTTKNDLNDINYETFSTTINVNNFVTTFDYLNENNSSDKNSYLLSKFDYKMNDSNKISFASRENKTTDLVEYYNFMYQYKNDCLAASIEYNKDYYNDRDVKPEENIFLKLTIIPFGETSSPDLKN